MYNTILSGKAQIKEQLVLKLGLVKIKDSVYKILKINKSTENKHLNSSKHIQTVHTIHE